MTDHVDPAASRRSPRISFVFAVHDPEYGGGLLSRTQKHLDALIAFSNAHQLHAEIVIVEWNPRQDRRLFRESLRWPDDLGQVDLRFLEVSPEFHRALPNADQIPIFEYIAKNAGLRRARGRFLLATNPDLFFSPALIEWLAHTPLSAERFYRIDRLDLSEEIPDGVSLATQLRFCEEHVEQVHALFGSYHPGDDDRARFLRDDYARLTFPPDGLHRNAAGDFFLMERSWWRKLRGYPELYTHAHIDAIFCWVASSAGLVQEVLPASCRLYHQAHDRATHAQFPQTDWRPWFDLYDEVIRMRPLANEPPMVKNRPDWGLANERLREWEACPHLVQVPAAQALLETT